MSEENEIDIPIKIIKKETVIEGKRKALSKDTIYKFVCEVLEDRLFLRLIEIESFSPYYFEAIFTLEELYNLNKIFKSCSTLESIRKHLFALFSDKNTKLTLEGVPDDDDQNKQIEITLKAHDISVVKDVIFDLKLKMVPESDKDKALMFLYRIQKSKNSLFEKIKEICQSDKGGNVSQNILALLTKEN